MMNTAIVPPFWPAPWLMAGAVAKTSASWPGNQAQPAQYSRAPGLSTGGKTALGALLFFVVAQLIMNRGSDKTPKTAQSVRVQPRNWQPPEGEVHYKPSFASSVSQNMRKLLYRQKNGQYYSEYQRALNEAIRQTTSLQEALDLVNTQGYVDRDIKDNPNDPNTNEGFEARLQGIQGAQKTDICQKADNGNPHKKRFYLFIGAEDKKGQFLENAATYRNEYGFKNENMVFTGGVSPGHIEAGMAEIAKQMKDYPHGELIITVMPTHCDRTKITGGTEGEDEFWLWDGPEKVDASLKTKESDITALLKQYLDGKNYLFKADMCRGGAIVQNDLTEQA